MSFHSTERGLTTQGQPRVASGVRCVHSTRMATVTGGPWPCAPKWPCKHLLPNPPSDDNDSLFADDTLGQGSFGTWDMLPSVAMHEKHVVTDPLLGATTVTRDEMEEHALKLLCSTAGMAWHGMAWHGRCL